MTVVLPATKDQYLSMHVINQDHFMYVVRDPGSHTLTQEEVGARFAQVSFRTFVNDTDPDDIKAASAVQDQIKVSGVDTIISL